MSATREKVTLYLDQLSSSDLLQAYRDLQKSMIDRMDKETKSELMSQAWGEWVEYKWVQHKFKFKGEKTEMYQKMKLYKDCNGDLQQMIETIFETMANGYKGLKIYNTGKQESATEKDTQTRQINPLW